MIDERKKKLDRMADSMDRELSNVLAGLFEDWTLKWEREGIAEDEYKGILRAFELWDEYTVWRYEGTFGEVG